MAHKIHSNRFHGWVNPAYHTNLTVTLWILLLQWNISESYLETIWMWGDWNGGWLTDLGTLTCGDNMKSVAMLSKWWVVQSQMAFKMAMLERTFNDSVKNESKMMVTPLATRWPLVFSLPRTTWDVPKWNSDEAVVRVRDKDRQLFGFIMKEGESLLDYI